MEKKRQETEPGFRLDPYPVHVGDVWSYDGEVLEPVERITRDGGGKRAWTGSDTCFYLDEIGAPKRRGFKLVKPAAKWPGQRWRVDYGEGEFVECRLIAQHHGVGTRRSWQVEVEALDGMVVTHIFADSGKWTYLGNDDGSAAVRYAIANIRGDSTPIPAQQSDVDRKRRAVDRVIKLCPPHLDPRGWKAASIHLADAMQRSDSFGTAAWVHIAAAELRVAIAHPERPQNAETTRLYQRAINPPKLERRDAWRWRK